MGRWLRGVLPALTRTPPPPTHTHTPPGADALDPDTLKPRPLGLVTRAVQGQNELWLALAFTHPVLLELSGAELASLLGALISADVVRRPTGLWTAYPASPKVRSWPWQQGPACAQWRQGRRAVAQPL